MHQASRLWLGVDMAIRVSAGVQAVINLFPSYLQKPSGIEVLLSLFQYYVCYIR